MNEGGGQLKPQPTICNGATVKLIIMLSVAINKQKKKKKKKEWENKGKQSAIDSHKGEKHCQCVSKRMETLLISEHVKTCTKCFIID